MTKGINNGEASYVNNDANLGANTMCQIGYQSLETTITPLIDLEMIVEIMRKFFGIQLKSIEIPMYEKSYR